MAAIVALLVVSGDDKVSTKDAFTLFENNTGWANSTFSWSYLKAGGPLILVRWLGILVGVHSANVDADRL